MGDQANIRDRFVVTRAVTEKARTNRADSADCADVLEGTVPMGPMVWCDHSEKAITSLFRKDIYDLSDLVLFEIAHE